MALYGDRVAGLPLLLDTLYYHPHGLRLADLATEVGRSERDVRETLRAYYLTDMAEFLPDLVARPDVLQFFGGDSDSDGDPLRAPMVRLVVGDPGHELGIGRTSLTDLARFYRLASDELTLRPDDAVLASAVRKLHESLLPGLRVVSPHPWEQLAEIRTAITEHRRIALTYARAWSPVIERLTVDPIWLARTRRGWELDAMPGDDLSPLRTYLLDNIRAMEVLDERFVPPQHPIELSAQHRRVHEVVLDVPHDGHWAVNQYAERVELIHDSVEIARLRVFLVQPVPLRVGLMLVVAGPAARVVEPVELRTAGADVARHILAAYASTEA